MDRQHGLRFVFAGVALGAAFAVVACASPPPVEVESPPPPPPELVALPSPISCRIGITRWEPGPFSDAFARRLRQANMFTEVYYPLESGSEMDAAIELDVHRVHTPAPQPIETILAVLFATSNSPPGPTKRFWAEVRGDLAVRVGERTLRNVRKSVYVFVTIQKHALRVDVNRAEDEAAGDALAVLLVEELSKDPARLATDIAAGPEGSAR